MDLRLWLLWRCNSVLIHLIAVLIFGFGLIFQFMYPWGYRWKEVDEEIANDNSTYKPIAGEYTIAWKYKYITYWNLNFQFFGFFIFLICDCSPVNYLPSKAIQNDFVKRFFRIRDILFHSILFPFGWFVCSTYWILYFVNRELVMNPKLSKRNPWWLTHICHTIIGPILIIEALVTYHRRSRKIIEMPLMLTIAATYLVWILYLGNFHNIWVYGIMKKSDNIKRGLFIAGCLTFMILIYFIGLLIHKYVWKERRVQLYPKEWSAEVISKDHEFEDFRVRQGLIKSVEI